MLWRKVKQAILLFSHSILSDSTTSWTAARQASLSFTISQSLLRLMSVVSVMPSNHLILRRPFSSCPQSFQHQSLVWELVGGYGCFRVIRKVSLSGWYIIEAWTIRRVNPGKNLENGLSGRRESKWKVSEAGANLTCSRKLSSHPRELNEEESSRG